MMSDFHSDPHIQQLIQLALDEDLGAGDFSSKACIPLTKMGAAELKAKSAGVLAGIALGVEVLKKVDASIRVTLHYTDGDWVEAGTKVFTAEGSIQSLLAAERTMLNFIQRLSGIATTTKHYVALIADTPARILDTRKTTPGFRQLEKWAVRLGGGTNHRMGLYDMVMLKDNHVDGAGGIRQAIEQTKAYLLANQLNLAIEVETRSLDEVDEAIATGGVQRIMLDNMSPDMVKQAVARINGQFETEVSGGIHEGNIRDYALTGVDFISIGALTHSVKALDLNFKIVGQ